MKLEATPYLDSISRIVAVVFAICAAKFLLLQGDTPSEQVLLYSIIYGYGVVAIGSFIKLHGAPLRALKAKRVVEKMTTRREVTEFYNQHYHSAKMLRATELSICVVLLGMLTYPFEMYGWLFVFVAGILNLRWTVRLPTVGLFNVCSKRISEIEKQEK